ncbi:hypothetical protein V2J09_008616 [Rumex salicifolius]
MNYCAIQQNGVVRSRDEMRSSFAVGSAMFSPDHRWDAVVCPKPRRVGLLSGPSGSPTWHISHQTDYSDSKAGSELLDIILAKGGHHGSERCGTNNTTSSPFLCGSPPSRVSNPLIQDAKFNDPISSFGGPSSPTSVSIRKGGCVSVRANFGNKPVVRIEGFDCLDRDRSRNCSIPALA